MNQPKRILVVDDKEFTRRGLKAFLANFPDYQVVGEAGNGQEAMQWMADHAADIIIMDINMPSMNGLEATQVIRRQGWPVKIVVWSISSFNRDAALAAGADAFVSKTESPDTILSTLHQMTTEISSSD
jgi:two-component system, NarL family, response regulator DegU